VKAQTAQSFLQNQINMIHISYSLPDFWKAFCALLQRWALKNAGTCFLQALAKQKA